MALSIINYVERADLHTVVNSFKIYFVAICFFSGIRLCKPNLVFQVVNVLQMIHAAPFLKKKSLLLSFFSIINIQPDFEVIKKTMFLSELLMKYPLKQIQFLYEKKKEM